MIEKGHDESKENGTRLTNEEVRRYSRHLILPEVGVEGQRRLKGASVLIVGTGGLGSPVSIYLAAAGVGRIGLVDFDVVDTSNLQRQILYSEEDVGRSKVQAAREKLLAMNPHIEIDIYEQRLSSSNALTVLKEYDVIVDGTDNFPTRYLVNDACVLLGKPYVYGSILRFDGQASVFYPGKGPCYRCLFPEPPPPGTVPSCAEAGVLGILPGVIGVIQATEAIKLILGKGEALIGRLLLFDALKMEFSEVKLHRDPKCPVCGENPTVKELIDYEIFCGLTPEEHLEPSWEIEPEELKRMMNNGDRVTVIDVRESQERQISKITGSVSIPLNKIKEKVNELSRSDLIVLQCRTGIRSAKALKILRDAGFNNLKNLKGGINAWADQVDPKMPKY